MNNRIIVLGLFAAIVGVFFSCKKNGEEITPTLRNEITLINAGPDTLNAYENGTRINDGSTLLPSGQYSDLVVTAGTQRYQFKKAGNPNALMQTEFNLNDSSRYTMFVAGETADRVFLLRDTLLVDTAANNTVAFIRYVNASPDAGNINFTIDGYAGFNNIPFKSATSFLPVLSGQVHYSMTLEGATAPFAQGNLTLTKGNSYTLFSKGLVKGTGTAALGARILIVN